jgi:hypothetical protein
VQIASHQKEESLFSAMLPIYINKLLLTLMGIWVRAWFGWSTLAAELVALLPSFLLTYYSLKIAS